MSKYLNAKPSFLIEDQVPKYVRANGQKYIDFIKSYYEWLEKKMVILTLKSTIDFDETLILDQRLSTISQHFNLITEEGDTIVDENVGNITEVEYQNTQQSISFDGIDQYGVIDHSIIDFNDDWTLAFWLKINDLPSAVREDYDVITLSTSEYMSLFKVSEEANEVKFVFGGNTYDTGIFIYKNIWNFVTIRYNSSEQKLYYDIQNNYGEIISYDGDIDLSQYSPSKFILGCDLYNSQNFFDGLIDELASWDEFLSNTDIVSIYNNGNPTNLLDSYNSSTFNSLLTTFGSSSISFDEITSGTVVANYIKFEDGNNTVAINSIDTYNNMDLYNDPVYSIDVPLNTIAMITEDENKNLLVLDVLSAIKFEDVAENILGNRVMIFCEHITGKLEEDIAIYITPEGYEVSIDSYIDVKSPLNVINSVENYQEIDFALNYGNYVYNDFFINCSKEIMYGMPLNLYDLHEESIKNIIAKNIKDLYNTKGTLKSFKYLFKILYNEDLEVGTDIYSTGTYQYTIRTLYASSYREIEPILNLVAHPVGFNVEFVQK